MIACGGKCLIQEGVPPKRSEGGECGSKDPSQANTYTSFIPLEYYTLFNYICVYYISMPVYYPGYPYPYLAQSYVSLSNLSPGDFVIMDKVDATTIKVKKDLVDPYNLIGGFVVDSCVIGGTVKVYPLNVVNNALAGLVIGTDYYADPLVAGGITSILPTGTAVIQKLGTAISATELDTQYFELIQGSGGGGGTNSNVLIDGGTFIAPSDNTLIDAGIF